jgi:predicted secreted protein
MKSLWVGLHKAAADGMPPFAAKLLDLADAKGKYVVLRSNRSRIMIAFDS